MIWHLLGAGLTGETHWAGFKALSTRWPLRPLQDIPFTDSVIGGHVVRGNIMACSGHITKWKIDAVAKLHV